MAVTVNDVARLAGVSPATVSRFLNKNAVVSTQASSSIQQAVIDLGYDRNATKRGRRPLSRGLAEQRTSAFGFLIPWLRSEDVLDPVNAMMMHGAEAYAREQKVTFIVVRQEEDGTLPPSVSSTYMDGIIARSGTLNEFAVPESVLTTWVFRPLVQPNRGDMVYPDSEGIGTSALTYLLHRNRHQLAVIHTPSVDLETGLKVEAFVTAAAAAGIAVKVRCCELSEIGSCATALLEGRGRVDGLFVPNGDDVQLTCLQRLSETSRKVGKDIDVIGCNSNIRRLRLTYPDIPNIDIRADEIGTIAATMLQTRVAGPSGQWLRTVVGARLDLPQE